MQSCSNDWKDSQSKKTRANTVLNVSRLLSSFLRQEHKHSSSCLSLLHSLRSVISAPSLCTPLNEWKPAAEFTTKCASSAASARTHSS